MQRTIEDITAELIRLPKQDRLEIVRFLLFLDNRSSDADETDIAWEHEIAERVLAVEEGTAKGIDYDEALKKIDERFAS
ncbi:MAG: addiction module protein [Chlorobiaceae bacterium]|nr:addiction module protein [Chlorobiaceae bacterium]